MANPMANIKDSENIAYLSSDDVVLVDDDIVETVKDDTIPGTDAMAEMFMEEAAPKRKTVTFYMRSDLQARIDQYVSRVNVRLKKARRETITRGHFVERALLVYFTLLETAAKEGMSAERYLDHLMQSRRNKEQDN